MPVVEEPPRLVRQLLALARGLLSLELPENYATALVRRTGPLHWSSLGGGDRSGEEAGWDASTSSRASPRTAARNRCARSGHGQVSRGLVDPAIQLSAHVAGA